MFSPHALPSMRTTLARSRRAAGLRRTLGSGGGSARSAIDGITGRGSKRASAFSTSSAGTARNSAGSTADPWTSPRSPSDGWASATTAASQATASPRAVPATRPAGRVHHAQRAAHQPPSQHRRHRARRRPGRGSRRRALPPCSPGAARSTAIPRSGGAARSARRASAPIANPARPSTFATRPRRAPSTADTTTHAITIRSTAPIARVIPFRSRRGPAGDVPDCRDGLRATRGRPRPAQPAHGGRLQGLERRGRRGQPRRGLSALGDRRRAVRGDRLGALHRLPADPPAPCTGRRRRPPASSGR